jgi:hypothetical protein
VKTLKRINSNQYLRVDNESAIKMVASGEYRFSTQNKWRKILRDNFKSKKREYATMVRKRSDDLRQKTKEMMKSVLPKKRAHVPTPVVVTERQSYIVRLWQWILRLFS